MNTEGKAAQKPASELLVTGMSCNSCAQQVTDALRTTPGVSSATVDLASGRATVRWNSDTIQNISSALAAVKAAGYGATPAKPDVHDHSGGHFKSWQTTLWIGGLATLSLMVGEWIFHLGMNRSFQWISFAVAGIVQIFAGGRFYMGAWRQLKAHRANMDTLVALGSTTAFGYSTWALLTKQPGHLYFMEAAAIITLISLGHWLEARVTAHAANAVRSLLQFAPQTARKVVDQQTETQVPVSTLQIDDIVALKPGDHIPTDGEVTAGSSTIDESMLTGESTPVEKAVGKTVYAGTVNLNGHLTVRVTATGEATALAHVVAAVEHAQSSRADIQRLGDRVANIFVIAVIIIGALTLAWWAFFPADAYRLHALLAPFLWSTTVPERPLTAAFICTAAVFIVACPCAMGLATPAAIMAAANAAAKRGFLIRDGVALEKAGRITAVIFDKTGTLTIGKPAVAAVWSTSHRRPVEILAAGLARRSSHPVSQAVAALAADQIEFADWNEISGAGVQAAATVAGKRHDAVRLGSLKWLQMSGVDLTSGENFHAEWSAEGATVIGLAADTNLLGLFAVKDTLKTGAASVVDELQELHLKTFLVTGDNTRTADGIAKLTGIERENVFAEVRPEEKANFVKKLQSQGERVAFVGDGINDAPALEQADLGIAVSRASDIAREAADIILLKSEIDGVPEALALARKTLQTIKQNLFWAFFYNAVSVPLAALGFMSPILCAAAMGLSDLVVIGNALRLNRWRG